MVCRSFNRDVELLDAGDCFNQSDAMSSFFKHGSLFNVNFQHRCEGRRLQRMVFSNAQSCLCHGCQIGYTVAIHN